ncbi:MAG: type II toxin-antitoxin system Phd/YefM family antitoxin [Candidatus Levybacteria bacterium]|nr:type II toxin-antitoxin system Phd/YefM family antitoxin [Candidatus Levybacteria bacterium]
MNIVNSTVLRNNLSDTLSEVNKKKDFLLVARKGKITSALVNIDLFEDLLALADKKYLASIRRARNEYENGDFLTHDKVFGEV